jgi:hypothetical protein
VALEVHGGVAHANNFQHIGFRAEENHVASFRSDPATGEEFLPEAVAEGIGTQGIEAPPDLLEIMVFLLRPPFFMV